MLKRLRRLVAVVNSSEVEISWAWAPKYRLPGVGMWQVIQHSFDIGGTSEACLNVSSGVGSVCFVEASVEGRVYDRVSFDPVSEWNPRNQMLRLVSEF